MHVATMSDANNSSDKYPSAKYPLKDLTHRIIGACFTVQRAFGYGFLESVYRRSIAVELQYLGIPVQQEVRYELFHRGVSVGIYKADLVAGQVLIETKAGPTLPLGSQAQLLNCLSASGLKLGLLVHFGPRGAVIKRIAATKRRSPLATLDH
jgi:GxxExxY protein